MRPNSEMRWLWKWHLGCGFCERVSGVVHRHDLPAPLCLRERPKVHNLAHKIVNLRHTGVTDITIYTHVIHGPV